MPPSTWLVAADVYGQFPLLKAQLEGTPNIAEHLEFGMDIVDGYLCQYGGVHTTDADFKLKKRAGCFFAIYNWNGKKENWDLGYSIIKFLLAGGTGLVKSGQAAGSDDQIYGTNEYEDTEGDSHGVMG